MASGNIEVHADHQILGHSIALRSQVEPAGTFPLPVLVDPGYHGRGIGSALYNLTQLSVDSRTKNALLIVRTFLPGRDGL